MNAIARKNIVLIHGKGIPDPFRETETLQIATNNQQSGQSRCHVWSVTRWKQEEPKRHMIGLLRKLSRHFGPPLDKSGDHITTLRRLCRILTIHCLRS